MAPMQEKEWTLMFYFASDQPLAPDIVTQLKAIKQAGFHPDANVVAQFDPNPVNAETHVFDINRTNKILAKGDDKIGFIGFTPNDPFVVNLMTDKVWKNNPREKKVRERIIKSIKYSLANGNGRGKALKEFDFDPPEPPPFEDRSEQRASDNHNSTQPGRSFPGGNSDEPGPQKSLRDFLKFCSDNYPARHYVLFIVGHGIVVGNDTFLFDEHTDGEHFLRLQTLGEELRTFKENIKQGNEKAEFELVSFHSCSMSSLEVAFEIQGTANFMLASQSPSFVGSYPYRQILIGIFNYLKRGEFGADGPRELFKKIFHYCMYNSIDFLVAGYSCDGCLCDLNKVQSVEEPVSDLVIKMIKALRSKDAGLKELAKERILLAHLEAQSYFKETHTDLFDFCFRLRQRIKSIAQEPLPEELTDISEACEEVMRVLQRGVGTDDDKLIIRSEFVGPAYQYSHGFSVYFPWFKPLESRFWPEEYRQYRFVEALSEIGPSWSNFLETYFEATRRSTRMDEFKEAEVPGSENEFTPASQQTFQDDLLEVFATGVFNNTGQLALSKGDPNSSQGDDCDCQSIKNYPPFTRGPQTEAVVAGEDEQIPVSPTFLKDKTFEPTKDAGKPALAFSAFDGLIE